MIAFGLCAFVLINAVYSANVIERLSVQDGAICDDRIPAYLVTDGHKLVGSDNKIIYKDVDEQECKNMCTDNKDDQGNQVMCSSFTYNNKERSCSVHRGKAQPVGKLELKPISGNRYFEKFCLPEGTPADCGEKPFFRADQAVLVGFAKNVSHTKHLTTCIQACIEMSAECRSAMFFGSAGECILSVASAQDAPDVFAEEEDEEKVVFFENGCVLENQIRIQKKHSISQQKNAEVKKPVASAKPGNNSAIIKSANATKVEEKKPIEKSEEKQKPKSEEAEGSVIIRSKGKSSKEESSEEGKEPDANEESQESSTKAPSDRKTNAKANSGRREKGKDAPKRKLLQNATLSNGVEEAWGPWSEECRSFDERRPCTNGNRVGFQSRQCLRTPFECQGPFFRYCIAAC